MQATAACFNEAGFHHKTSEDAPDKCLTGIPAILYRLAVHKNSVMYSCIMPERGRGQEENFEKNCEGSRNSYSQNYKSDPH